MLTLMLHEDQIIRITVGNVVVRLRMSNRHTRKLAIEAPANCPIDRFRISTISTHATLEGLERATGVKVGGRGASPAKPTTPEKESHHEDRKL